MFPLSLRDCPCVIGRGLAILQEGRQKQNKKQEYIRTAGAASLAVNSLQRAEPMERRPTRPMGARSERSERTRPGMVVRSVSGAELPPDASPRPAGASSRLCTSTLKTWPWRRCARTSPWDSRSGKGAPERPHGLYRVCGPICGAADMLSMARAACAVPAAWRRLGCARRSHIPLTSAFCAGLCHQILA